MLRKDQLLALKIKSFQLLLHSASRFGPPSVLETTLFLHLTQVIGTHIDDVEALGNIGAVSMQELSRVLARNRGLSVHLVKAFSNSHGLTDFQGSRKCSAAL